MDFIVDAEGYDVVVKVVTSVIPVPYLSAMSLDAYREGTSLAMPCDAEVVCDSGPATKSSVAVEWILDLGTAIWAYLVTALWLYLPVSACDVPNVAPAEVELVGLTTPHGCGVGGELIVSVASGDSASVVCNCWVGVLG